MGGLLIVTGPPGAGKSTVAGELVARHVFDACVAGDPFFTFLGDGAIDPWLPEAHRQNSTVIRAAARATGQFIGDGYDVVYDGVVGPWFLPTFAQAAGTTSLDYVVLLPSVDRCVAQVTARERHAFRDNDATRHMHQAFVDSGIESRHVISEPPPDVASLVALVLQALEADMLRWP